MNFTNAEKIYLKAEFYNWDLGIDFLKKLLLDKDCDKATAMLVYWRSDPEFYYGYESENDIPEWSRNGYQLMKAVEQSILNDEFPELISYEADADRIPKDINVFNKIPKKMFLPSVGINDSSFLANQFYYGKSLIEACRLGDLDKVIEILDKKPSVIDVCVDGNTPIYCAIKKPKVFDYLLSKGVDINNAGDDEYYMQPIHSATLIGKNKIIKTLLNHGADINAQTANNKRTPLHVLTGISMLSHHWEAYKLTSTLTFLLKNGADTSIKDINGNTPLEVALSKNNVIAIDLIEKFNSKK